MSEAGRSAPERRVGSSMALLTDLMERPLDPGYQAAADRRARLGQRPSRSVRTPLVVVASVVIGALLAISAQTLRVPQDAADRDRNQLIGQIRQGQAEVDRKTGTIAGLQGQISAAQQRALDRGDRAALADQLSRVEQVSGAVAVRGPGLQLTLDDSPTDTEVGERPRSDGAENASVTAQDLQILANGLWQAGSEAIAINGQRLTSTSSIRFAGAALTVDFRPIARPYVVSAIGPRGVLRQFEAGPSGTYLKSLPSQIKVRLDTVDNVRLPPTASTVLQYATPSTASAAASSSTTQRPTTTPEESP